MLDAIILRDLQGVIISWNQGAEKLFGWTRDEALGKHANTLLHTRFPQPLEAIEAEVLRAGHWEGELVHTRRDGTPVVVTSRWAVWQQDHGAPLAIVEISTDVTERKQVERSQRLLAEAGPVLAASLDATSRLANIAQVVVPLLADWCVVHITEEGQPIQPVAVAHADPQKLAAGQRSAAVAIPPTRTRRRGRPRCCAPASRSSIRKHRRSCSPPSPATPSRSSWCGRWGSSRR